MKCVILTLILAGFVFCGVKAQLSTEEIPYSWERGIRITSTPEVIMPNLDIEALNKEDLENEGLNVPVRFGFSHDVNFNLLNSGVWQTTCRSYPLL